MKIAWKTWLASALAAGAAIIMLTPTPTPRMVASAASPAGWEIPALPTPTRNAQPLVADLVKAKLWGGQLDAAVAADDGVSRWRIAGITGRANERVVLVLSGDDKITPLKAGDKFPDNTTIAEVKPTGICVILEGKKRFLPIDGQTIPLVW